MCFLKKLLDLIILCFLATSTLILSVLLYIKWIWPDADFEQISMTAKDLTLRVIVANTTIWDYLLAFLFFIIIFPICYLFLNIWKRFIISLLFCFISIYLRLHSLYHIYKFGFNVIRRSLCFY